MPQGAIGQPSAKRLREGQVLLRLRTTASPGIRGITPGAGNNAGARARFSQGNQTTRVLG